MDFSPFPRSSFFSRLEYNQNQPFYQRTEPCLGLDGQIYRLKLEFPFRVCSNCGQDNIVRPVIGKHGIPFIPGSGIKGLFERLSRNSALDSNLQARHWFSLVISGKPFWVGIRETRSQYKLGR